MGKLRRVGAAGPFYGAKHPYVRFKNRKIIIPNPHGEDIGPRVLRRIISDLGISEEEFEDL